MRRSKILFLDHAPFVGGAQLALVRHLNFIDLARFEAVVLSGRADFFGEQLKADRRAQVRCLAHHFGRLKSLSLRSLGHFISSSIFLLRFVRSERPDLIVINTERCLYVSLLSLVILRVPSVVLVRDFEFSPRLLRLMRHWVKHFVCVSRAIRDHYFTAGFSQASVIYVGTDLSERLEAVTPLDLEGFRKRFNLRQDFLIGFVGRLVDWKGPLLLVEMAKILVREGVNLPAWKIVVVGQGAGQPGDVEAILRRRIEEADLFRSFLLTGFSQQLPFWYRLFSVLLHTSRKPEPFATVVVEALAAGVPVLATNLGGTPEVIASGRNGFLLDYRAEAFAQAIKNLMRDAALRQKLAQGARATSSSYEESIITHQFEAIYLKVLGTV